MAVRTYDPQDVNVIVNGVVLTGLAEGTFVSIEREEESYTSYVGAKGEVARAVNANKMGTITVTLEQTSPSNAYLRRLANSNATFPVSVVDQNSGETSGGNDAWIQQPASKEFGDEISTREWTFVVPELEI